MVDFFYLIVYCEDTILRLISATFNVSVSFIPKCLHWPQTQNFTNDIILYNCFSVITTLSCYLFCCVEVYPCLHASSNKCNPLVLFWFWFIPQHLSGQKLFCYCSSSSGCKWNWKFISINISFYSNSCER